MRISDWSSDVCSSDLDVAALAVHLQDLERLRHVHQRGHVAHRADIDLAAGQEGDGAVEVDGEAALDAAEDHTLDAAALGEFGFELVPCGFAAGAVTAQHRFAVRLLDAVDIDLDFVADLEVGLLPRPGEFAQRPPAFPLQPAVGDGQTPRRNNAG